MELRQCPECFEKYATEDEMCACMEKHIQARCKHEDAGYTASMSSNKLLIRLECEECNYVSIKTAILDENHDDLIALYNAL